MTAGQTGFRIADYEDILETARAHEYSFGRFTEPAPEGKVVYLRHDIDNSVASALRMAEVEARHGAVSTYLALVRSENYNVFSKANRDRLRRILELGHDVGLHFSAEEHAPDELARDLAACISKDAALLEQALDAPVRVFSFHNPADREEFGVEVPGLVNTYADRFVDRALYLSESNMRWQAGSPVELLTSGEHPVVQILVHPLSYQADFRSDRDVLLWFLRDKVRDLLELNVGQNRVLRESGLEPADVAAILLEEES